MDRVYKVRFTNWKDGSEERFFTTERDAEVYADSFRKYGYTVEVKPIYFEEVGVN